VGNAHTTQYTVGGVGICEHRVPWACTQCTVGLLRRGDAFFLASKKPLPSFTLIERNVPRHNYICQQPTHYSSRRTYLLLAAGIAGN